MRFWTWFTEYLKMLFPEMLSICVMTFLNSCLTQFPSLIAPRGVVVMVSLSNEKSAVDIVARGMDNMGTVRRYLLPRKNVSSFLPALGQDAGAG